MFSIDHCWDTFGKMKRQYGRRSFSVLQVSR